MNIHSSEVLTEIEAILKANTLLNTVVAYEKALPLAQETANIAAYLNFTNSLPKLLRNSTEADAYDFHGFFLITLNVNCETNKYLIYDVVDSVVRSILNDTGVWVKLEDRDIISVEYDNAEFYPKRSAILAIETRYRLTCN